MTWTQTSDPLKNEWVLWEEDITLDSSTADQLSSVIDFLAYGKDWILEVDPSATLASNATIDLDYCYEPAGTYTELATTGISALKAGTAERVVIDNSAKGNAPYLKVRLDKAAALDAGAAKTVKIRISVPPRNGIVY